MQITLTPRSRLFKNLSPTSVPACTGGPLGDQEDESRRDMALQTGHSDELQAVQGLTNFDHDVELRFVGVETVLQVIRDSLEGTRPIAGRQEPSRVQVEEALVAQQLPLDDMDQLVEMSRFVAGRAMRDEVPVSTRRWARFGEFLKADPALPGQHHSGRAEARSSSSEKTTSGCIRTRRICPSPRTRVESGGSLTSP